MQRFLLLALMVFAVSGCGAQGGGGQTAPTLAGRQGSDYLNSEGLLTTTTMGGETVGRVCKGDRVTVLAQDDFSILVYRVRIDEAAGACQDRAPKDRAPVGAEGWVLASRVELVSRGAATIPTTTPWSR